MTSAVVLSCHGTVSNLDDVGEFLANIRRGRPTPPEVVDEVRRRLHRIGGSPLMRITEEQAAALQARIGAPVRVAARQWHPYPADVVGRLVRDGVRTIVSLPLAPQYVDVYHAAMRGAVERDASVELRCVPAWGLEPAFVEACVESVDEALSEIGAADRQAAAVVLTAHSLPQRVIDAGDPYERDFRRLASLVKERIATRGNSTRVSFQSQGMTNDAWLGPDLVTTFADLRASGVRDVVVAPIGFVADHVETLYDLDIEAKEGAKTAGLRRFVRAPSMNTRPRFIDALENVARAALCADVG